MKGTGGYGRAWLRRTWAAAGPSRASTATRPHWCGGHRRVRAGLAAAHVGGGGAWPGFEIDRSEPQARVWRSRGRAAAHGRTKQPGLTKHTQRPEHPWGLKRLQLVRLAARLAQGQAAVAVDGSAHVDEARAR